MGNCGSTPLNCTLTDLPIEGDPDVAGIGVLTAFIATAAITYLVIIVGYVTDSIQDASLSELDKAVIRKIKSLRQRLPTKCHAVSAAVKRSASSLMGIIGMEFLANDGLSSDPILEQQLARDRRVESVERFVLALSDQQLVTGLAVLIAAFTNRCTRSMYHFQIIASLAWFSSTTHLSTLTVLRVYLINHAQVRHWRVATMLAILFLLGLSQVLVYGNVDYSLPVQCCFARIKEEFPDHDIVTSLISDYFTGISLATVIFFLAVSYTEKITRLYSADPEWSISTCLLVSIMDFRAKWTGRRSRYRRLERIIVASSRESRADQGVMIRTIKRHQRLAQVRSSSRLRLFMVLGGELSHSFLSELLTLLFGVSYGITQVVISRQNTPLAGIIGNQNAVGFGQLVPLLLLGLPMLAAGEVFSETHARSYGIDRQAKSEQTIESPRAIYQQRASQDWSREMDAPLEPWFLDRLKREGWKSDARFGDMTGRSDNITHHSSTDANGGNCDIQLLDLESNIVGASNFSSRHQEASTTGSEITRALRQAGLLGKKSKFPDPAGPFLWRSLLLLVSAVSVYGTAFAVTLAIGVDAELFTVILLAFSAAVFFVSSGESFISEWKPRNRQ